MEDRKFVRSLRHVQENYPFELFSIEISAHTRQGKTLMYLKIRIVRRVIREAMSCKQYH